MKIHKSWPMQSAGPSYPVAPISSPLLRIVLGDPRSAAKPVQWYNSTSEPSSSDPLQTRAWLGDAVAKIELPPSQSVYPIPKAWFDFTFAENYAADAHLTFEVVPNNPSQSCKVVFLLSDFASTNGIITRPLLNESGRPIASFRLTFLRVMPHSLSQKMSDQRRSFLPRFTGHRGMGSSGPKAPWRVLENTPESFLATKSDPAVEAIELDVQLTADHRTVVFHDWFFRPCDREGHPVYDRDAVRLPVHNLTFDQFDKLYRQSFDFQASEVGKPYESDENSIRREYPPDIFTVRARSLRDICEILPEDVGMLLEFKYPSPDMLDRLRITCPDRNVFLDIVLDELLTATKTRRNIALLCFDPEVCNMLALKQNKFPVYFSHREQIDKPCDEFDPRCTDVLAGLDFVKANHLQGLMLYNKLVELRPDAIDKIVKKEVPILTYGKTNSDPSFVQKQFNMGIGGVIADDVLVMLKDLKTVMELPSSATLGAQEESDNFS